MRRREKEIVKGSKLAKMSRLKRKSLRMTQLMLSRRAGVSLGFIKRLEGGDINLQYAKILQVLDYLGIELTPVESEN